MNRSSALARAGVVVGIAGALAAGATHAANRLEEITEKWRKARAQDVPLATRLRPLVQSDAHFRADAPAEPAALAPDMRRLYYELDPILTADLRVQFLGLSSDALRAEWLRRYWQLRDPTPTTPENERLAEHERRVRDARRDFAAGTDSGWDDRGTVWIAFGAPDSTIEESPSIEEGLGYVPARAEWLYLDERWVVEFERPNPRAAWKLGRSSARLSHRPDLVSADKTRLGYGGIPGEMRGAGDYERMGDIIGFQEDRELLAAAIARGDLDERLDRDIVTHSVRTDLRARDLLRKRQEGLVRFRKAFDDGNDRFEMPGRAKPALWYVFDVDAFKGQGERTRIEVHYQLDLQNLKFAWKDSLYLASYRAEAVLYDRDVRVAGRDSYVETVKSSDFRSTVASQLVPGQLMFDVAPGTYRLAIRIADSGGAEGTYMTSVEVPHLSGRELALSDILMASSIVYAGDDWRSRFVKNDRLIVPNPLGAYPRGRSLVGYFEIYGLRLDDTGVGRYEVRYAIAPRSIGRGEGLLPEAAPGRKPYVTSTFRSEAGTSQVIEELRIDITALESDLYDLVLTVHDLIANVETASRSSFSILD
jgi:GWxTD domain-containing protein